MEHVIIRKAEPEDCAAVAAMCHSLWPKSSAEDHARELAPLLAGRPPGDMPLVVFIAEVGGAVIGFIEVDLRSHADGCDPSHPVGYIEGWYVEAEFRRQKIGARLMHEAERWARGHGCREIASDTWLDNDASERAHIELGFEVVDRCVHFRKELNGNA